ncbi:unnamed protein product, partial [Brassica rapa subsp. trilocularis]
KYNETHFNENRGFKSVTIPIFEEFEEQYNLSVRLLV